MYSQSAKEPWVARLSEITDPAAVEAAARRYREVGRTAFLSELGFAQSQDYFCG